jgi:hypothetical protein
MYKFKTKEEFADSYRKIENLHGRTVSDLDVDRVYARYKKIFGEMNE